MKKFLKELPLYVCAGVVILNLLHILLAIKGTVTITLDYWYSLPAMTLVTTILGWVSVKIYEVLFKLSMHWLHQ